MSELIKNLSEPPQSGELEFTVDMQPVSLQARRSKKTILITGIRELIKDTEYYLSGDVKIEIEWLVHEEERYGSHTSPDVDNIIKVVIDALSGPDGLLINDCQVQSISCYWVDLPIHAHRLNLRIRFSPDEWLRKVGLIFVEFTNKLCFPINDKMPRETRGEMLEIVGKMLQSREELENRGVNYYDAKGVMPIQRFFHKLRLTGMHVVDLAAYRATLDSAR